MKIDAWEMSHGDPAYSTPGHVDFDEFKTALAAYFENEEGIPSVAEDMTGTVKHIWFVREPVQGGANGDEVITIVSESAPGAVPVTMYYV